MKNLPFLLTCFILLASCKKESGDNTAVDEIITDHPTKEIKISEEQCYLKVTGKDSIKVNFTKEGDSITGIYHNLPYGIDKRISTFKGILKNNHGIAISKYSAEGSDYIEEIHFTIESDNLHLNYGPTEQGKDGIWRLKPGEATSEHVLPEVNCK